jgi:hypothetical protein
MKLHAAYSNDVSFSMTLQCQAGTTQYSPHEPMPPINETLFPKSLHACNPFPCATTIPDPSNPTLDGYYGFIAYMPYVNIMSEGLIGAAITNTKTSPEPGIGVSTPSLNLIFPYS